VNYGIVVSSESDYNLIYKNYFINNGIHALDEGNSNNWNSSIIGNYWDDYPGYDDDFDGIGDTPYIIPGIGGGQDNYPIWTFQSPIHIDDSPASPIDWAWAETQPWCSGSGTFSDPYVIDGLNITARGVGDCILIGNSSKYFIVRNCKLIESGSSAYDAGLRLDHAGNGTLINNNCSFNNRYGMFLYYSDNTTVSGNTANNNSLSGIYNHRSANTTVSGNIANNNQNHGIYISHSDNITVSGNTANYNEKHGILISDSDDTTVSGNTANNNQYHGIWIYASDNTTITENAVNNNKRYGIDICSDNTIVSGNTANNNQNHGINIYYSDNTTVSGNIANNNQNHGIYVRGSDKTSVSGNTANNNQNHGIYLLVSDNTTVSGNTVKKNQDHGIRLFRSNSTTVSGNIVDNNVNYGIYTRESDYNLIYKNHFINNGIHALDEGYSNNWNSSIIGNYWDNYTGYDDDFDGIGDTPHNFGTGIDNLPIWNFQSPIHIDDSPASPIDWAWAETQPWCTGSELLTTHT
jgi:parallel beta-helix repeat protein